MQLRTPLCDRLGIRYPILLAGMGGMWGQVVPPALVAAVSNAGGLGVTGLTDVEPEEIRRRIRQIRELTDRPFGIDLLLPASMDEAEPESVEAIWARIEREHPEHVAFTRRLMAEFDLRPRRPDETGSCRPRSSARRCRPCSRRRCRSSRPPSASRAGWCRSRGRPAPLVLGLAGSARHAARQKAAGVDLIVAQGAEAGGHTGTVGTMVLVPEVVDAVAPTPVLAAGGIVDGRGIAAALALGAQGVWLGTAFLLAAESGLYPEHKQQIIGARSEDFVVTRAFTGKTARDVRNPIIDRWERSGLRPAADAAAMGAVAGAAGGGARRRTPRPAE